MVHRHISDDLKEMALSMSLQGLRDAEIREYTGISERSLKRLRHTHRNNGALSTKRVAPGRPRVLTAMEVKVSLRISISSNIDHTSIVSL
jgi:transposase